MTPNSITQLVENAHKNALAKGFWHDLDNLMNISNNTRGFCKRCEYRTDKPCEDNCSVNEYIRNMHTSNCLMLIVTELAEAVEGLRKGDKENLAEELADACIRIFDLCGGLGIDLETAINDKMAKNTKRQSKHGKLF